MALEKGLIPATIGLRKLNPKIKAGEWNVEVVTEHTPWPQHSSSNVMHPSRASVSSFGYGGANAHAILEAAAVHVPKDYSSVPSTKITGMTGYPMILPFSASNNLSLQDRITSLSALDTSNVSLRDLSHTLGSRRSHLPVRGYLIVDELYWKDGLKSEDLQVSDTDEHRAQMPCAFVFSGQGAQWPEMGRQLIDRYSSFEGTIRLLDQCLTCLPQPPNFSIHGKSFVFFPIPKLKRIRYHS